MEDSKSINRDEISNEWSELEESLLLVKEVLNKIFKFSSWVTGASLGLLGFYIALLLQIKLSQQSIPSIEIAILLILPILLSIGIGIYLRTYYEILDSYNKIKDLFRALEKFLNATKSKFEEKGVKIEVEDAKLDFKIKKLEKPDFGKIVDILYIQLGFFIFSLISVSWYLISFLLA